MVLRGSLRGDGEGRTLFGHRESRASAREAFQDRGDAAADGNGKNFRAAGRQPTKERRDTAGQLRQARARHREKFPNCWQGDEEGPGSNFPHFQR